jgi:hypothetical protein
MHQLWQTLTINNCSAYVKFCNSSAISLIQRPFARARVSIFFLLRDSTHMAQIPMQPGANTGPLNYLTGSELLDLTFLVTPSTLSKIKFSNTSGAVSAQKSDTIF